MAEFHSFEDLKEIRAEREGCLESSQHLPGSEWSTGRLERDPASGAVVIGWGEWLDTAGGKI